MRAVNLMPGDVGGGRAASTVETGAIVYVLLGGLAVMVALVGLWALSGRQITEREATLTRVSAEATAAEKRAAAAAPYEVFAALARDRVATVKSLSATRFDWSHSLRELGRVLPADVWLTSIDGSSGATGAAPAPNASAAPAPTFELVGCTRSQTKVARLLARLRAVDNVRRVTLKASEKPDADAAAGDCPASRASNPTFTIKVAFAAPGATTQELDATGQPADASAAAAATAPAAAGTTGSSAAPTPASTTTPPTTAGSK